MLFAVLDARGGELEIYQGEPFAEALHDVVFSGGIAISHKLAKASSMSRTDVFRMPDGKILVIASVSKKLQDPYSVKEISIAPPGSEDSKYFKIISRMTLSPRDPSK